MSAPVPKEFHLVVACCRWPPSEQRNEAIRAAAADVSDWARFLRIVRHHRVAGLARDGLRQAAICVPAETAGKLHEDATALVRQNLQFVSESVRLQTTLNNLDIPNLFVKGIPLAQLAYGGLSVKHSWDIDLLVTPKTVTRAIAALMELGYFASPPLPSETDPRYQHWIKYSREYIFTHKTKNLPVELHWRLTDNEHFLQGVSAETGGQIVIVPGENPLRTLNDDDLFSYLSIHGAFHGWARLKWLADVAALISGESADVLERRFETARRANADHCVAQAFLLCHRLFDVQALSALSKRLRRRWRYRYLEKMAFDTMSAGGGEVMPGASSFDMTSVYFSHFLVGHGFRYVTSELRNKLQGPYDLLYSEGKPRSGFLYPARRMIAWLRRGGRTRNAVESAKRRAD